MKQITSQTIQKMTTQLALNVTLAVSSLVLASSAQAQTMLVKVLQNSDEIVAQVYQEVPVKSCRFEKIPIYGAQAGGQQASTADVVASAIFGSLYMAMPLTIVGNKFYSIFLQHEQERTKAMYKSQQFYKCYKLCDL